MAPLSSKSWTTAVWPCSAAHIRALVPRRFSVALTVAPWLSSILTPSSFPVRAAIINAVSPRDRTGVFASAPAFNSVSIIGALPFTVARNIGVAPSRFAACGFAPARINAPAISRSSHRAAQWSAVVPSACGAFTFAFC